MSAPEPLTRDFLVWIANQSKPYAEALERWRTSCPRVPVWEDAFDSGFVSRSVADGIPVVELTAEGRRFTVSG